MIDENGNYHCYICGAEDGGLFDTRTGNHSQCEEIKQLREEVLKLREYKEEIENAYKTTMDEKCTADEQHCTCVPLLKIRIAEAEKVIAPFAFEAEMWGKKTPDDETPTIKGADGSGDTATFTVGDLRAAAEWMKKGKSK